MFSPSLESRYQVLELRPVPSTGLNMGLKR